MTGTTTTPRLGLTPYITVHDAAAAIEWYKTVFGAIESVRYVGKDGRIGRPPRSRRPRVTSSRSSHPASTISLVSTPHDLVGNRSGLLTPELAKSQ
jgi:uncharacterized glyoxalase superfamily protein PhnB